MYSLRPPAPTLAHLIEHYWFVDAREHPVDLQVDVYVDGRADLVFNFGAPWTRHVLGSAGIGHPPAQYTNSVLDCQRRYPMRVRQQGAVRLVGVRFLLGGLGAICSLPLRTLTDQTPNPTQVWGPEAHALEASLRGATGPDDAKILLDTWFSARMQQEAARVLPERNRLERALVLLQARPAPGIGEVAHAVGSSARALERIFDRHIGLPPRTVARILRFQWALRALMRDPGGPLSDLAHAAGYCDQAHFVREFKEMTGGVPRGYRGYYPPDGPHDFAPNVVVYLQDGPPRGG